MVDKIVSFFSFLNKEALIFVISMLPIVELRGAIPVGAAMGMGIVETFLISVIGNLLPVPFIILLARPLFTLLKKTRLLSPLVDKIETRTMAKADKVMKNAALGLFLFVAIPLPGTGAWTGALLAALLNMRFKYALPSIVCGVIVAGIIVTLVSFGFASFLNFLV